ncbi:hypothetical protein BY996DRAFT_2319248 [Phakopsora pachyrhizi]|uniref:Expressed protein n=1 Tax=Phakopsora pachyrhizi TaxID=170000 RepID=A0AAV0B760_PHAPC|nr:hypothetical protein BY996DRAFT_2319248 [Phakopsora pachyrhizi]CAH7680951.1 expressed protein [Phakopsora pachyrhizi]
MYPKPLGRSDVSWTSRRNSQRRRGDPIINEKPRSRRSNRNSIIIKLFPGIYLTKEGQQDEYVVEDEKLKDDVYTNSSEYDDYRNFGEKETVNLEVEKAIEDITTGLTDLDEDKGLLKGSEKKDTLSGDLEEKETPKDIQGGGKTLINQEEIQNLNIEEEKGTLDDIQEEREVKPIDHEIKELAREKTQENISREPSERSSDRKIVLKDEDDKVIEIIVLNEESEKARQKSSLQNRGKCWRASSRVVKGGKRTSSLTYSIDHRDRRRNGFRGDDRGCEEGCGCDETMKRSNRLSAISIVSSSIYNYFKSK